MKKIVPLVFFFVSFAFTAAQDIQHEATGGLSNSSGNIAVAFGEEVEASENYYLLYYVPQNYKADGRFHSIEVKVKGKKYRVFHGSGYVAD